MSVGGFSEEGLGAAKNSTSQTRFMFDRFENNAGEEFTGQDVVLQSCLFEILLSSPPSCSFVNILTLLRGACEVFIPARLGIHSTAWLLLNAG
jgi:hypothetical protein